MKRQPSTNPFYLLLATLAGLGLAAVLAGAFRRAPGEPSLGLVVQLLGAAALFLVLERTVPILRRGVAALDPVWLTTLQAWRILGMMFLFLMALGELPAVFAVPAGVGDVLVGLAAPLVADRMRRGVLSRRAFAWFTALGLLDFVTAFAAGNYVNLRPEVYGGFASMTAWPLVLVPGFFVPLFAVLHLAAWRGFTATEPGARADRRVSPVAARRRAERRDGASYHALP